MKLENSKFHFVGIGGVGMSGLAELVHNMGAQVTGSDLAHNSNVARLESLGIKVFIGHAEENVGDVDVVVFSSAVDWTNPELVKAHGKKIPIIRRAEVLAEIMRLKRGIAVAGTHGKTTTTSLLASIFLAAQTDPTVVVGGRLDVIKSTAVLGEGTWLIAEADESDGSFLNLSPEIVIITNIDNDHLDHYGSFENLKKTYREFALKAPFYGLVVVCGDDPHIRSLFKEFPKRILYYGFNEGNDLRLIESDQGYEVRQGTGVLGSFRLTIPGDHNALNALAAIAVSLECGIDFDTCVSGLENFGGVDRRFQKKGELSGISVYDDYGHHPTEVSAVIQAFKKEYPDRRLVVAFQPHRFSRTQQCWDDFLSCFSGCDELLVFDIYKASENQIEGVTAKRLCDEIDHPSKQYLGAVQGSEHTVSDLLCEGDVFVTLGAGDIYKLGETILKTLDKKQT